MIKLSSLFDIKYGNSFALEKMEIVKQGISFVARGSQNNGIEAIVSEVEGVQPFQPHQLTISLGGSVMETFYQEKPFYTAYHVKVLTPKIELTKNQMLYYCMILRHNKYRYSYGRQANKTVGSILVPSVEEIPEYVNNTVISYPSAHPTKIKAISLHDRSWEWFKYSDIFRIQKGERLTKSDREKGNTPLCTSKSANNGIVEKINKSQYIDSKKIFKDKITIDMFHNVFYHDYEYFSDDNVHTLINKNKTNIFIDMFIATVAKADKYRYDYGRQLRLSRLKEQSIKLPVDSIGDPDWQFMEDYIKSLPYSSNL